MNITLLATLVAFLFVLAGVIALFVPFSPPIPTIWLGIFVYTISHHFSIIDRQYFLVITLVGFASILLEFTLASRGARHLRSGGWGLVGAIIGGVVGMLYGQLYAYILGPIIGAIAFELLRGRDRVYTYTAGKTKVIGFMGVTIMRFMAAAGMVILFIAKLQHHG